MGSKLAAAIFVLAGLLLSGFLGVSVRAETEDFVIHSPNASTTAPGKIQAVPNQTEKECLRQIQKDYRGAVKVANQEYKDARTAARQALRFALKTADTREERLAVQKIYRESLKTARETMRAAKQDALAARKAARKNCSTK